MAKGKKIGSIARKPGTLVYVTASGDIYETQAAVGGKKGRKVCPHKTAKKASPKKKAVKKVATKKKAAPKKAVKKAAPKKKSTKK